MSRTAPRISQPYIGQKVRFTPASFCVGANGESKMTPDGLVPIEVTGEIIEINADHRWYRVRFICFEYTLHECFKY